MERMNSAINVREAELMEVIRINNRVIKQLEEENKKLKEENEELKEFNTELNGEYKNSLKQKEEISNNYNELREENKKLNLQIAELMGERDGKQMKIEELEKELKLLQAKYDLVLKLYNKYGTTNNTDKIKSDFIYRM